MPWGRAVDAGRYSVDPAGASTDIPVVRALFLEYHAAIGVDLCFQGFDAELAGLPGAYAPPGGALLLAWQNDEAVGCAALRPFSDDIGELKRVYVRPAERGTGLGRALVEELLSRAASAGYAAIRLDTLPGMEAAIALYETLGFVDIEPYTQTPVPGARFLELRL